MYLSTQTTFHRNASDFPTDIDHLRSFLAVLIAGFTYSSLTFSLEGLTSKSLMLDSLYRQRYFPTILTEIQTPRLKTSYQNSQKWPLMVDICRKV